MGVGVGYCIYLPPGYETETEQRYPVVYHLHGGRPGSELKSVGLTAYVDRAIRAGEISPTIYVFPNGGPMSWYNWVGTKGFNYESNLKFSEYLGQLGVAQEKLIAEGVAHSAKGIDAMRGGELMKFHQRNFSR